MNDEGQQKGRSYTFPIVVRPQVGKGEALFGYLIIILFFSPIFLALVCQDPLYLLGLLLGFVALWVYDLATGGKFRKSEQLRQPNFITFTETHIELNLKGNIERRIWDQMHNVVLYVIAYHGQYKEGDGSYDGTENKISFANGDVVCVYSFYIRDSDALSSLCSFLQASVLPRLYALKTIKNENLIISQLPYEDLQIFKQKNNIDRYTDQIYFNP